MEFTKIVNSVHYKIFGYDIMEKSVFVVDKSMDGNLEIIEEEYVDESVKCNCKKDDCEECDPEWLPGIDTCGEESDSSDYDSSDSMDEVYEDCGLSRAEKKVLQDELRELIEDAEASISHQAPHQE